MSHTTFNTLKEIVEQLESCGYECEAGKLENNIAFQDLKQLSQKQSCPFECNDCSYHESKVDYNYCASCVECGKQWMEENLNKENENKKTS